MRVAASLVITAGCLVLAAASSASAPQRIPFEVVFDTAEPLGLRLDAGLTVLGFSRKPDGSMSHAEASGLIKPSDTLVGVNGKDVSSMDLQRTVMEIRDAELPKVLSFLPSHPGEDRAAEVQRRATSLEDASTTTGVFELALVGTDKDSEALLFPSVDTAVVSQSSHGRRVLKYSIPVVVAHFGGLTSCSKTKVVLASPRNGCGSFQNEGALANAIVIVERGGCRFSDKAINVQTADGAAMVVVNDDGPAIRMPFAEDETMSVHVPSLMVSQPDGALFTQILEAAARDPRSRALEVVGRLTTHNQVCGTSFFPAVGSSGEPEVDGEGDGAAQSLPATAGVLAVFLGDSAAVVSSDGTVTPTGHHGGELLRIEYIAGDFGARLPPPSSKATWPVVFAHPADACSTLTNPPESLQGAIVVVERGGCTFDAKYQQVVNMRGAAMAVVNEELGLFAVPSSGHFDAGTSLPPVLMVSKDAGVWLRKLLSDGGPEAVLVAGPVVADDSIRQRWESLETYLDSSSWPAVTRDRRKLYGKLSLVHHPDKPTGSVERFEMLSYAYRKANHAFDPSVPFEE